MWDCSFGRRVLEAHGYSLGPERTSAGAFAALLGEGRYEGVEPLGLQRILLEAVLPGRFYSDIPIVGNVGGSLSA